MSRSSAPLISRYILRLGQAAQKHQRMRCSNRKMYLEIRGADEWALLSRPGLAKCQYCLTILTVVVDHRQHTRWKYVTNWIYLMYSTMLLQRYFSVLTNEWSYSHIWIWISGHEISKITKALNIFQESLEAKTSGIHYFSKLHLLGPTLYII